MNDLRAKCSPTDSSISLLNGGSWVPYITYHNLEEIACHGDDASFLQRFTFLAKLQLTAYLKLSQPAANVGCSLDLRELEMKCLLKNPKATFEDIIQHVRPKVRNGFVPGHQLVQENLPWWRIFRDNFAEDARRQKADIANVCHFESIDGRKRLPAQGSSYKALTKEGAAAHFAQQTRWLEEQIRIKGDCRDIDPKMAAEKVMGEALQETLTDIQAGGDFIDAGLARMGVERARLPRKPRIEDVGDEGIFVAQAGVHARRLGISKATLLGSVRKEQLPSWCIWKFLDRKSKTLPKAEIGNVNDKAIASFAPYVDLINLDKRMTEFFRQADDANPVIKGLYGRLPRKPGPAGLLEALKQC